MKGFIEVEVLCPSGTTRLKLFNLDYVYLIEAKYNSDGVVVGAEISTYEPFGLFRKYTGFTYIVTDKYHELMEKVRKATEGC